MRDRDGNRGVARERVIESMEQSAEVYGLSRSAGRVYGVLFFAAEPLSIGELVEETGYAKSTVSTVTRRLVRVGLIHRRSSEGGGRRVLFEPEREVWFVLQEVFQQYVHREIQTTLRTIRRAERQLPEGDVEDENGDAVDENGDAARIRDLREAYADMAEIIDLTAEFSLAELREALETYDR